jgi:hypothetical protein
MNENRDSIKILQDAISHPVTSISLVTGLVLTAYSIALAPFLGGFAITFPAGLAVSAIGAGSGVYQFFKHQNNYNQEMTREIEGRLQEENDKEQAWMEQTLSSLKRDFVRQSKTLCVCAQSAKDGGREIIDLLAAKEAAEKELQSLRSTSKFVFDINTQIEPQIKNVFKQGLLLLCNVRDLIDQISTEDEDRLKQEMSELKNSIATLETKTSEYSQKTLELKRSSLLAKEHRLTNMTNNRDLAILLLSRTDECENTLRSTYENLIKMSADDSEETIGNVLSNLQNCVRLAVEVRKQFTKTQASINV